MSLMGAYEWPVSSTSCAHSEKAFLFLYSRCVFTPYCKGSAPFGLRISWVIPDMMTDICHYCSKSRGIFQCFRLNLVVLVVLRAAFVVASLNNKEKILFCMRKYIKWPTYLQILQFSRRLS
jgi:hypothetical protein